MPESLKCEQRGDLTGNNNHWSWYRVGHSGRCVGAGQPFSATPGKAPVVGNFRRGNGQLTTRVVHLLIQPFLRRRRGSGKTQCRQHHVYGPRAAQWLYGHGRCMRSRVPFDGPCRRLLDSIRTMRPSNRQPTAVPRQTPRCPRAE